LWVGGVYLLIIGVMTLPNPLRLTRELIGDSVDNWIFYWNNWWLGKAIQEGLPWFETSYLFYPTKTSLVAHSNSFLSSLLALPLEWLAGPIAAYNMVFLSGLWIGAMGMFLLLYEMTHRISAALLAGFVFAFAPYHLTQLLAHAHLGSIHWWPFFALFLSRLTRKRRLVDALAAGVFASLTVWSGFQLGLLLAVWTGLYVLLRLLRTIWSDDESPVSPLQLMALIGLTAGVALLLSAPIIVPVAKARSSLANAAASFSESTIKQTDLLAYLLPPRRHPLVGSYVVDLYARFVANKVASPYLGYTVVGLALLSVVTRQKGAGFWFLATVFSMVLAAGSMLRVNGVLYPHVRLPYSAIDSVFPISSIRAPDRYNLLVVFSLAVSCGLGGAYLAEKRRWLLVPLGLLICLEFLPIPLPTWELPSASPFFDEMAQDRDSYGVVDYPMSYPLAKRWLYYQTIHEKPSVDGHVSRYTPDTYAFITSEPLLRALYQETQQPHGFPESMFQNDEPYVSTLGPSLRSLESSGVRYILFHKSFADVSLESRFRRVLPAVPVYDDASLAVYDVAHPLPQYYNGFPVHLTPDVDIASFGVQREEGSPEWQIRIVTRLLDPDATPIRCKIQLAGDAGSELEESVTLFDALPSEMDTWLVGDLGLKEITVSLPERLEPGTYRWGVICPGGTAYARPETVEVQSDGLITYLRRRVHIRYGESVELQGYRWSTVGPQLEVTLRWKTLVPPESSYKVFVHLMDPEGKLAAQYDGVPCDWQCPTNEWRPGDIVLDRAQVPLGGLSVGEYRLAVGLYSQETGERLTARRSSGMRFQDDYPVLPDPFVISDNSSDADDGR